MSFVISVLSLWVRVSLQLGAALILARLIVCDIHERLEIYPEEVREKYAFWTNIIVFAFLLTLEGML